MKSNNTPFTDVCKLISREPEKDTEGYDTSLPEPVEKEIFCSFYEGVSRTEFYEAMKAGMKLTATVEIWEDEYSKEREIEHAGLKYNVVRTWPTGHGTILLYLKEVVH